MAIPAHLNALRPRKEQKKLLRKINRLSRRQTRATQTILPRCTNSSRVKEASTPANRSLLLIWESFRISMSQFSSRQGRFSLLLSIAWTIWTILKMVKRQHKIWAKASTIIKFSLASTIKFYYWNWKMTSRARRRICWFPKKCWGIIKISLYRQKVMKPNQKKPWPRSF